MIVQKEKPKNHNKSNNKGSNWVWRHMTFIGRESEFLHSFYQQGAEPWVVVEERVRSVSGVFCLAHTLRGNCTASAIDLNPFERLHHALIWLLAGMEPTRPVPCSPSSRLLSSVFPL